ncbi:MAG TPA: hypothetical protein VEI02_13010 [Planctomycetota bacterium]|nr:hypothetical protein [Planctomycetota bacterium]
MIPSSDDAASPFPSHLGRIARTGRVRFRISAWMRALLLAHGAAQAAAQAPSWEFVGPPDSGSGPVGNTWLAFDAANRPVVVYKDDFSGGRVSVRRFDGTWWSCVGGLGAGSLGAAFYNASAVDAAGVLHVAHRDYAYAGQCNVRSIDLGATSPTFVNAPAGPGGVSAAEAHATHLAVGPDGSLFVIYADRTTNPAPLIDPENDRATARRLVGGAWQTLGPQGFSPGKMKFPSIAVDAQGTVYAAFTDFTAQERATVMIYDANTGAWSPLGAPGFSGLTPSHNVMIALDGAGVPHVAFFHLQHVYVMRHDPGASGGTQWTLVGGQAASATAATWYPASASVTGEAWRQWISLSFDAVDRPYVAFQAPAAQGGRACVKRFDGVAWRAVGPLAFSPGDAAYLTLALDHDDVPYVAFRDGAAGHHVTVMRFTQPAQAPPAVLSPGNGGPGAPTLSAPLGNPFLGRPFSLAATGSPGALAIVAAGIPAASPTVLGPGSYFHLDLQRLIVPVAYLWLDAQGAASATAVWPGTALGLVGTSFAVQAVQYPFALPTPSDVSNGLLLTVGF